MGGSPKKPEPSENERALAEVGAAKAHKHRTLYNPVAKAEAQDALSDDIRQIAVNRNAADVAQAKGKLTYANVAKPNAAGIESIMQAQKGGKQKAEAGALGIQNKRLGAAISTANKQGGQAQNALSSLAQMNTKEAIGKMQNDMTVNSAKWAAAGQVAAAAGAKYSKAGSGTEKFFGQLAGLDQDQLKYLKQ